MNTGTFYSATAFCLLLVAGALPAAAQTAPTSGQQPANVQAQMPARTEVLFGALDTNKDKALSLQEFQAGYAGLQRAIALEVRLREQFRTVDADRSGAIEAGEYANLVLVKQAGAAAPGLAAFDANKNQKLEFVEYLTVVHRLAASQPATPVKK
ncbi:hypothetical protein [Lysobacter sp. CFH 32150]|uniref:hypothetical protein n=1 Tax=Lysobacter sp. CFH 32150 TaxID=2927128 RepID=UPI001FA7FAF4|nr:hypothetical protein [Lysobacter sp. CFH 32150]MCI4568310.1 hypothetical protein [Lysobacter sp. CFH 32150]